MMLDDKDLVKPKINESAAFANKSMINDLKIGELEDKTSQGEKDFDREAFDKLKQELS